MSKKKMLALAIVVIMIAILSFSSLAWFTDADSAKNDFTVAGAGEEDPDKIFSVDVKENVDGEEQPVDGMEFEDVLPGDKFKKEAYVSNTGSYEQYIRVTMTITDWEQIEKIVTIKMDEKFAENWAIADGGVQVTDEGILVNNYKPVDNNGNLVVTLYLKHKLQPNEKFDIMDYVEISKDATQADFAATNFDDGFQIVFDADAAQTENILDAYGTEEWKNAQATFEALS